MERVFARAARALLEDGLVLREEHLVARSALAAAQVVATTESGDQQVILGSATTCLVEALIREEGIAQRRVEEPGNAARQRRG